MTSACALSSRPVAAAAPASDRESATTAFVGRWAYVQSCGWQHPAELEFKTTTDKRYLELHPVVSGREISQNSHCPVEK